MSLRKFLVFSVITFVILALYSYLYAFFLSEMHRTLTLKLLTRTGPFGLNAFQLYKFLEVWGLPILVSFLISLVMGAWKKDTTWEIKVLVSASLVLIPYLSSVFSLLTACIFLGACI
jgi:hypothetical protein